MASGRILTSRGYAILKSSLTPVQEKYILEFYDLVKQSEMKIKEIDSKQLFQSDDEVGFFFTNLKTIQEALSDYIKFIK
jgi:hypothetical protein